MVWFRKLCYNETHCNTAQKQPLKQKFHLLLPGQNFPPWQCMYMCVCVCVCVCVHVLSFVRVLTHRRLKGNQESIKIQYVNIFTQVEEERKLPACSI